MNKPARDTFREVHDFNGYSMAPTCRITHRHCWDFDCRSCNIPVALPRRAAMALEAYYDEFPEPNEEDD